MEMAHSELADRLARLQAVADAARRVRDTGNDTVYDAEYANCIYCGAPCHKPHHPDCEWVALRAALAALDAAEGGDDE